MEATLQEGNHKPSSKLVIVQNVPTYFMINLNIVLSNLHMIKDDTVVDM